MTNFSRPLLASVFSLGIAFASTAYGAEEATYPPSIQKPVAGEPIIAPTEGLKVGVKVVVPLATADSIPQVKTDKAVSLKKIANTDFLTSRTLSTTPVKVSNSIQIGGVTKKDLANVPVASFRGNRNVEVQKAEDVPIVIEARGLPSSASAQITLITGSGSQRSLGRVSTSKSGELRLPPITLFKGDASVTIRVVVGGKSYNYTVRTTA